ncbi:MAG: TIGR03936 family radical SAM-associated protein [Clostridia bacterium]|nr:TIGR03936 family radical SAM-associated protein [Clostridia bacterium]
MSKYLIKFNKLSYAKYISHLDMNRMFRRIIRASGIKLSYSQGYNPHPKMNFAQPLPLAYEGYNEMLMIECDEFYETDFIEKALSERMPLGFEILSCVEMDQDIKSLAAIANYSNYTLFIPGEYTVEDVAGYLNQAEIKALKRMKKTKEYAWVDIKDKILAFELLEGKDEIQRSPFSLKADSRAESILSPELVIQSFLNYLNKEIPREEIDVERNEVALLKSVDKF